MRVAKVALTKIVTICQHLGRSRQSKALSSVHCRVTSHNGAVVAVCLLRGAPCSYEPSFYVGISPQAAITGGAGVIYIALVQQLDVASSRGWARRLRQDTGAFGGVL